MIFPHAIYFLTSLKNTSFFISSDNEFHICGIKTLGNCSNTFPIDLSNHKHFVWFGSDKGLNISLNDSGSRSYEGRHYKN